MRFKWWSPRLANKATRSDFAMENREIPHFASGNLGTRLSLGEMATQELGSGALLTHGLLLARISKALPSCVSYLEF